MLNTNKICFLIEITLFLPIYLENEQNLIILDGVLFPSILTLFNQNIVIVRSDGIHFYTRELVEDSTKTVFFEKNITDEIEGVKVEMVQFPEEDDGYIMILVGENIFFFESDGSIINNTNLNDIINDDKYSLIPYKKEGNDLFYVIVYNNVEVLIITLFTFNIDSHENSVNITKNYDIYVQYYDPPTVKANSLTGINCFFTKNTIIDYDILTCIYSTYFPTEIHVKSFDPNNDFMEIVELFNYYFKDINLPMIYGISAIIDLEKKNIFMICVSEKSFRMTFNFDDFFSEPILIFDDDSFVLAPTIYKSKLYYFSQTNEYLFSSYIKLCTHLVMKFNSDFTLKEKGLSYTDNCYNSFTNSVFYDGTNYRIVSDNGNTHISKIFIHRITLVEIPTVEKTSTTETSINNKKTTDDITNFPSIKTTLTNVYNSSTYINAETTINNSQKNTNNLVSTVITTYNKDKSTILHNLGTTINNKDKSTIVNNLGTTVNKSDKSTIVNNLETTFHKNDKSTILNNLETTINNNDKPTTVHNLGTTINNNDKTTTLNNFETTINNNDKSTTLNNLRTTINNNDKSTSLHNLRTTINNNDKSTIVNNLGTTINNNDKSTTVHNFGTTIINNNNQGINQDTELTTQSIIKNHPTYHTTDQNTVYENNSQNMNYNVDTVIINGVVFQCSNNEFYKGKCDYENNPPSKKDVVDKFRDDITNHKIDDLLPTEANQEDLIIKDNKTSYQITNSYNQIYKVYHDISSIKLGECEKTLKDIYHIDYETPLLIFKIDNFIEGSQVPIIEYEVYDSKNKTKLNLNHCKSDKINLVIPVSIDEENIHQYNLSSNYYNDKCTTATSKNNTDILLNDRIDEYYEQKRSICEDNCNFNEYNKEMKKANCQCEVKTEINEDSDSGFNSLKLIQNFIDLKIITNIDVIKCIKVLFSKQGFTNNYGNYCILSIIVISTISLIHFLIKGYKNFITMIDSIIKNKKKIVRAKDKKTNTINQRVKKTKSKNKNKNKNFPPKKLNLKYNKSFNCINLSKINDSNCIESSTKIKVNHRKLLRIKKEKTQKIENISLNFKRISIYKKKNNNKKKSLIKTFENTDYELNLVDYQKALMLEKRTFFKMYISLLRSKHVILFTFFNDNNYNVYNIKVNYFFFTLTSYLSINVLFFNDLSIHNIYENEGKYDFLYQLPQIIYSTIISSIVNVIIRHLSLSEKEILLVKNNEKIKNTKQAKKCIILKFHLFFILTFVLLIFFWFYLSCFCAVYKNSQKYILTDTSISYGLSLLYPFLFTLIACILRTCSINSRNNKRECIYTISQIL